MDTNAFKIHHFQHKYMPLIPKNFRLRREILKSYIISLENITFIYSRPKNVMQDSESIPRDRIIKSFQDYRNIFHVIRIDGHSKYWLAISHLVVNIEENSPALGTRTSTQYITDSRMRLSTQSQAAIFKSLPWAGSNHQSRKWSNVSFFWF